MLSESTVVIGVSLSVCVFRRHYGVPFPNINGGSCEFSVTFFVDKGFNLKYTDFQ